MKVTPYGTPQILAAWLLMMLFLAVVAWLACRHSLHWWWLAPLPVLLFGWVLWFFRDPPRRIPRDPNAIVSPADGVVTHVDEVDEPLFIGGRAKRVSIFLSVFNVHLNRAPLDGTVRHCRHTPGKFRDARDAASNLDNEHQDVGFESSDPRCPRFLVRQIAGLIARRIVCPLKPGDVLEKGAVYGMIKFGSRTTLLVPADAAVTWNVGVGDKVAAGSTVIGQLAMSNEQ